MVHLCVLCIGARQNQMDLYQALEPRMIPYLAETVRGIDTASVCSAPDSETVRGLPGLPQGAVWAVGIDSSGRS